MLERVWDAVGSPTVGPPSLRWEPTPASLGDPAHLRHPRFSWDSDGPSPEENTQASALQGSPPPAPSSAEKWQKQTVSGKAGLFLSFPPGCCFMRLTLSYQNGAQDPAPSNPLTCAHAQRRVADSLGLGAPEALTHGCCAQPHSQPHARVVPFFSQGVPIPSLPLLLPPPHPARSCPNYFRPQVGRPAPSPAGCGEVWGVFRGRQERAPGRG